MAYQQPGQPVQEPTSPGSIWWNLQKTSSMINTMNSSNFSKLGAGQGMKWGGVVGLRRLALGDAAFKGMLPGGATKWAQDALDYSADGKGILNTFKKKGLFGVMGQEDAWWAKAIGGSKEAGRISNKGLFNDVAKKVKIRSPYFDPFKPSAKAINEGQQAVIGIIQHGKKGQSFYKTAKSALGFGDDLTYLKGQKWATEVGGATGKGLNRPGVSASKYLKGMRGAQLAGKIGSAASNLLWLSFAYDIASLAAQGVIGVGNEIATKIETQFGSVINRRQEFGGQLGAGFISSRASTERQRALSAMRSGYGGRGMQGNEASMYHQ